MRLTGLMSGAAIVAVLLPAAVLAQRPVYAPSAAAEARPLSQPQRLERRFLQISAANLRLQAEASRLAETRSNNPAVKELAQLLLAHHQAAQPELLRLLQRRSMAMPLAPADHLRVLKQLGRLNGARFDRVYVEEVVQRSLQAEVANHEKLALQAEDPVLRAWVERQLPTLRFQLAKAARALPAASLRGQRAV